MRHFLEKDAIFSLNLSESFLHESVFFCLRLQVRSSTWAFIIDSALHVSKLKKNKRKYQRGLVRSRPLVSIKNESYLLFVTFLTFLNVPFHASFVLHWHCLPATVHGCSVWEKDGALWWNPFFFAFLIWVKTHFFKSKLRHLTFHTEQTKPRPLSKDTIETKDL